MRRIYESNAVHRDDEDPFSPGELDRSGTPQAMRSVSGTTLSRYLVPDWLRYRAVSLDVSTPRAEYPAGADVPFAVTMTNAMPFPITITTSSPLLWTWHVDGVEEASRVSLRNPPDEAGELRFDRGERKRFSRRWTQQFRVSETEWEPAGPGEYTIGAELNVDDPAGRGVSAETTVRVVPE